MTTLNSHDTNAAAGNPLEALGETTVRITHLYGHWARQQGISYHTLAILSELDVHGSRTQKQICDAWMLPKQTISNLCRQLHEDGHLVIEPSGSDRREKRMLLSDKGRALAAPILDKLRSLEAQAVQQFGNDRSLRMLSDLRALEATLNALMRR